MDSLSTFFQLGRYGSFPDGSQSSLPLNGSNASDSRPATDSVSNIRGYTFVIAAGFFFACDSNMEHFIQAAGLISSQGLFFLSSCTITILSLASLCLFTDVSKTLGCLNMIDVRNLIVQGINGALAILCLTFAFARLPSGIVLSIFYINPILSVFIAGAFLKERVSLSAVVSLAFAFGGALLVTQSATPESGLHNAFGSGKDAVSVQGFVAAFCAALFGGFLPLTLRILLTTSQDVSVLLSCLSLGLSGIFFGGVLEGYSSIPSLYKNGMLHGLLFCIPGGLLFLAQLLIGMGFQLCDAGTGAIMSSMELPMAYLIQVLLLGEKIRFWCIVGALMILSSAVTVGIMKVIEG